MNDDGINLWPSSCWLDGWASHGWENMKAWNVAWRRSYHWIMDDQKWYMNFNSNDLLRFWPISDKFWMSDDKHLTGQQIPRLKAWADRLIWLKNYELYIIQKRKFRWTLWIRFHFDHDKIGARITEKSGLADQLRGGHPAVWLLGIGWFTRQINITLATGLVMNETSLKFLPFVQFRSDLCQNTIMILRIPCFINGSIYGQIGDEKLTKLRPGGDIRTGWCIQSGFMVL